MWLQILLKVIPFLGSWLVLDKLESIVGGDPGGPPPPLQRTLAGSTLILALLAGLVALVYWRRV